MKIKNLNFAFLCVIKIFLSKRIFLSMFLFFLYANNSLSFNNKMDQLNNVLSLNNVSVNESKKRNSWSNSANYNNKNYNNKNFLIEAICKNYRDSLLLLNEGLLEDNKDFLKDLILFYRSTFIAFIGWLKGKNGNNNICLPALELLINHYFFKCKNVFAIRTLDDKNEFIFGIEWLESDFAKRVFLQKGINGGNVKKGAQLWVAPNNLEKVKGYFFDIFSANGDKEKNELANFEDASKLACICFGRIKKLIKNCDTKENRIFHENLFPRKYKILKYNGIEKEAKNDYEKNNFIDVKISCVQ